MFELPRAKNPMQCYFSLSGQCAHADGVIHPGQRYTWSRKGAPRQWHAECPQQTQTQTTGVTEVQNDSTTLKNELGKLPTNELEVLLQASLDATKATKAASNPTPKPAAPPQAPQSAAEALAAAVATIASAVAPQAAPMDESRVREIATDVALEALSAASPDIDKLAEQLRDKLGVLRVEIKRPDDTTHNIQGKCHKNLPLLLNACSARDHDGNRLNVWLCGPAGTGKTTAATTVAQALGLECYAMGAVSTPEALVGYVSPINQQYQTTVFRRAYEHGGVMLLDEIDGSDGNAMLILNQALANGWYQFPDGARVKRHADFVCIGAANTWGQGATTDYVGRFKADAAFLDRFVQIEWPIDEEFELALCGNKKWCLYVQSVRRAVAEKRIRVVISPRASLYGAALLAVGMSGEQVTTATLRKGMTAEQWQSLNVERF